MRSSFLRAMDFSLAAMVLLASVIMVACDEKNSDAYSAIDSKHLISAPRPAKLGSIPANAAIMFLSTRDGKKPTIMKPNDIYVMNAAGQEVTRITFAGRSHDHAVASPDRKKTAVVVQPEKDDHKMVRRILVLDLEKGTEQNLVPNFFTAGLGGVDWSNDDWIYFAGREYRIEGEKDFDAADVYRVRPDGSELRRFRLPGIAASDVSVSEDGSMVAFLGFVVLDRKVGLKHENLKPQTWVMNTDGTGLKMVDDGGKENGTQGPFQLGNYDPEISPDNKYVVFSRSNTKSRFKNWHNMAHDIWVVPIDGTGPAKRITREGPLSLIPDWHGNRILYTEYSEEDGYIGLVTIDPDGGNRQRLEPQSAKSDFWKGGRHGKWFLDVQSTRAK